MKPSKIYKIIDYVWLFISAIVLLLGLIKELISL